MSLENKTTSRESVEGIRPARTSVLTYIPPLIEQSLLQLEQSLPNYRLAQRNLDHWFFYIQSTFQDTFDTFLGLSDPDFYPSAFEAPGSTTPLSQADFQESHHSPAGSSDLFGYTARTPPPELQVVVKSYCVESTSVSSTLTSSESDSLPHFLNLTSRVPTQPVQALPLILLNHPVYHLANHPPLDPSDPSYHSESSITSSSLSDSSASQGLYQGSPPPQTSTQLDPPPPSNQSDSPPLPLPPSNQRPRTRLRPRKKRRRNDRADWRPLDDVISVSSDT